tara:strand:- start:6076 stop:6735 length:660 start_codon:yes stop_codon:yes gene_type:complete
MAGLKQIVGERVERNVQDKWLLKALDTYLTSSQRPARTGVFYPSSLGSPCDRFLYNSYFGLVKDQPIDANTKRIFDCGDYLGYRYEKYFEKMGILLGTEIAVKSDDPPISGRLDFLIKHEQNEVAIVELKSINKRGFIALSKPKDDHYLQTQLYLNLSNREHGIVLYECKDDQKVKAFVTKKDVKTWENIKERCEKIMSMTEQPSQCTGLSYCPCRREK